MSKFFSGKQLIEDSKDVLDQWDVIDECSQIIIEDVTGELDDYMNSLPRNMTNLSDNELEDIIMQIPQLLYWVNVQLENVGGKEDVAHSFKNKVFRESFLSSEGSIANKKAKAENDSYENELVTCIYSVAYKSIKAKTDMAFELMQSAKKIMNRRIAEININNVGGSSDNG